jgi:hypothetical protein
LLTDLCELIFCSRCYFQIVMNIFIILIYWGYTWEQKVNMLFSENSVIVRPLFLCSSWVVKVPITLKSIWTVQDYFSVRIGIFSTLGFGETLVISEEKYLKNIICILDFFFGGRGGGGGGLLADYVNLFLKLKQEVSGISSL